MSIGPFSLIVQAIGEVMDTFMITKRFQNDENSHAVEIIGFSGQLSTMIAYVGLYFGQALTTRVSTLIGSGDRQTASHLISDVIYLCILSSLISGAAFVFLIRPFLKFLNTPEYMLNPTFKYLIPTIIASPLINLSNIGHYFLQSIGNSILAGLVKVVSYGLQIFIFSPLFLFAFKVSTTFMKLGSVVAHSIVGIGMIILIYIGKFSLKPKFSDIFDNFSSEIKNALLFATPLFLSFFVFVLPPILILQTMTSMDKSQSEEIGGVFAVFTQISMVNSAIPGAFGQSFLSAGTHAFGCNNMDRLVRLFLWTLLFNSALTFLVSCIVIPGKSFICRSFLHNEKEIKLAEKMFPVPFYTSPLQGIGISVSMLMIVIGKPLFSFIPQMIQMIILCAGCKILAHQFKGDATKIMYIYNISDITVFLLYMCFIFIPIKVIKDRKKEFDNTTTTVAEGANQLDAVKLL